MLNAPNTNEMPKLQKRPYQKEAIDNMVDFLKGLVNGTIQEHDLKYKSASLLEMATGSGKIFAVGKILEHLIKLRNRFFSKNNQTNYFGLNVLVLSNRIDGVEQFRDDLVHLRKNENKAPILGEDIIKNLKVSTFHSKADKLDDLDERYFTNDLIDEEEIFSEQNGRQKDHIMFSTYQTANLKELDKLVSYFDIIIIDEAHNVKADNEFRELIDKLSNKGRDGSSPYILPLTATPTNLTEELFGEPIFSYGLPEYLASEYSPDVNYKLITQSNASKEDIESLNTLIEQAKK